MRTRESYCIEGTGPRGAVALLLTRWNGIGDDIAALPVVAELARKKSVTVYTTHPELWRGVSGAVVAVAGDEMTCDNGEFLGMWWDDEHRNKFELIYKLSGWGCWEDNEFAKHSRTRFEQLAEILGCEVPESFDYKSALLACMRFAFAKPYTVLAPQSHGVMRSLPLERGTELYEQAVNFENTLLLADGSYGDERELRCVSLRELIDVVYNAERVIGIDNGIAHIAAALGRPLTVIAGMTDANNIFSQYEKFNPNWEFQFIQQPGHECESPCYGMKARGFSNQLCCGSYALPKCMESVNTGEVVSLVYSEAVTQKNAILTQ